MLNVLHAEVAGILDGVAAELPAAEAHGCLCGALCVNERYSLADWLAVIAPAAQGGQEPEPVLGRLYETTINALRGDDMEFTPLLPDDDTRLAWRTEALAQWVQGFLYGLAAGDLGRRPDLSADVTEILQDFAAISRATVGEDADAAGEADEEAFAELHEFVRVGVQLIHDELSPLRRRGRVQEE